MSRFDGKQVSYAKIICRAKNRAVCDRRYSRLAPCPQSAVFGHRHASRGRVALGLQHHEFAFSVAAAAMLLAGLLTAVRAQQPPPAGSPQIEADVSREPPHRYASSEIVDAGPHFFGGISKGLALIVEEQRTNGVNLTVTFSARRREALSSVACDTAMVPCTPRMPATYGCSGRGQQSALTSEPMARAP